MSNKRIYFWTIYIAIVICSTIVLKHLELRTTIFEDNLNKYASWIIYGVIVIMGYKNFIYDPRNKGE